MLHSPPQRRVRGGALGPSPALPLPPTGTREAAFVYAISSAGVAFAVTRACSSGELEKCGCDRTVHGVSPQGECGRWEGREWQAGDLGPALTHSGHGAPHPSPPTGFQWSGCSDNIAYGVAFSQSFVDVRERSKGASSSRALMNLHNNEAGRKVVWHFPCHRHRQGRGGLGRAPAHSPTRAPRGSTCSGPTITSAPRGPAGGEAAGEQMAQSHVRSPTRPATSLCTRTHSSEAAGPGGEPCVNAQIPCLPHTYSPRSPPSCHSPLAVSYDNTL